MKTMTIGPYHDPIEFQNVMNKADDVLNIKFSQSHFQVAGASMKEYYYAVVLYDSAKAPPIKPVIIPDSVTQATTGGQ